MRRPRRTALLAVGALVVGGLTAIASPAQAAVACQVNYQKAWDNGGGGFGANVTITNVGDPLTSWSLVFDFPNQQRVDHGWSANWSQTGQRVTATNMSWNGNLATGQVIGIGFNGSYTGGLNNNPQTFSINGVTCNGAQQQSLVVAPTAVTVAAGSTATYAVRLQSQPSANVTVTNTAGAGNTGITVQSGASLTFTSANWNTNQTVTLAASTGGTAGDRIITVASANLQSVNVTATKTVPPSQGLVVNPTTVSIVKGATGTFSVALAQQPSANVTVTTTAGTGSTNITLQSGGTLTFTPANWNTPQTVTLASAAGGTNGSRQFSVASGTLTPVTVTANEINGGTNPYLTEFLLQYEKIKNPANGYFSPEGIPYHSVETLMIEAPDHGHETTSEAFSFWIWLEARYGQQTGNWAPFNNSWNIMEQYIIPSAAAQPGQGTYNPNDPADYAPERNLPSQYPVPLDTAIVAGQDPLANELQSTYGNRNIYAMHWLLDVDDVYGYGNGRGSSLTECGDNTDRVTYINTYQRGPQESVWETVPHPSCETGRFGQSGSGYPPLFIGGSGSNQWRYTNAPDADARAIEAVYWALQWATAQGNQSQISATVTKAARMGDFLRYAMYDKYFKNPGCAAPTCAAGSGKSSSAYLLSWYFAWGGDTGGAWSWRIGSSHFHGGYQNPLAAWAMSPNGPTALRPQSPTAATDWNTSFNRQLQFIKWLQSADGGIAGGATNSWNGAYEARPTGPQFFGMTYDVDPVYHDPPSNQWFGFQGWGVSRVAEMYYATNNALAKSILDSWVPWAIAQTQLGTGTNWSVPSEMTWSGAPSGNFNSATGTPAANPSLRVNVTTRNQDIGVAAALTRTLIYYAAHPDVANTTLGQQAKATAKGLLDRMLALKDTRGVSVCETRTDYRRYGEVWNSSTQQGLFVPSTFSGTMPNGDPVNSTSTFRSIRTFYNTDQTPTCTGGPGSGITTVNAYAQNQSNPVPSFRYHRFWAQADFALALADYGALFPNG
ncbi:MAG TPA: glycoside hydrolase family 48 protein [Candidatus Limnocylindrales bacterium]